MVYNKFSQKANCFQIYPKIGKIILNLCDLGKLNLKKVNFYFAELLVHVSQNLPESKITKAKKYRKPKHTKN
jgi:hypothetical protein